MYRIIATRTQGGYIDWADFTDNENSSLQELQEAFPDYTIEVLYEGAVEERIREINSLNLATTLSHIATTSRDYRATVDILSLLRG